MQQKPLSIHCLFPVAGEPLCQLVQRSFSLYLRRMLEENGAFVP